MHIILLACVKYVMTESFIMWLNFQIILICYVIHVMPNISQSDYIVMLKDFHYPILFIIFVVLLQTL